MAGEAAATTIWPRGANDALRHKAIAVVKGVDAANGKVTLAHEPIESLKWPAMTMSFVLKGKSLFA
jgi:Cu(I)/Ag(I) efflux system periplasmic protein CusF